VDPGHHVLLERDAPLSMLEAELAAVRRSRRGRLILLGGEAGVGKSAVVQAFCASIDPVRVLRGACDPLTTPRPLGPLIDIAEQTGGELAALVGRGTGPSAVHGVLATELARLAPCVVVLEDLHWADEATLDVLRLLARRIETLPAVVVATFRDDLDRDHPLRIALGELPTSTVRRLPLASLSAGAVAQLAAPYGVDPGELYRRTGGNPFFVTETLAAGDAVLPATVRDAVLARAARLDREARDLLDVVAIVPTSAELWLLEGLTGGNLEPLDRCISSGMLRAGAGSVAFRHEIARVAVESDVPPARALALHRAALATLSAAPNASVDLAHMAHHAEQAGDADAVLRYAPAAGDRAAELGSHREAAAQFARALRFAAGLKEDSRARLLERRSYECYLTGAIEESLEARREAMAEYQSRSDRLREGDAHRWLSRLSWIAGRNRDAEAHAVRAVELLQGPPPGRELAMAYSNMAQLRMLADDLQGTRVWGARAIGLAEAIQETEILVHALTNVGTAESRAGEPAGTEKLERGLRMALAAGLEEHVARAYTNLSCMEIIARDYAAADRHLTAGIAYCQDRDLDSWRMYMSGWQTRFQLEQCRWDDANALATVVATRPGVAAPSRLTPLVVIGRLRARRGDPDPWEQLDEAAALAEEIGEPQRLLPVAAARAEARWLAGETALIAGETDNALEQAGRGRLVGELAEILLWRRRAGLENPPPPAGLAEPFGLELAGEYERAAQAWAALGCRYEAALALLQSSEPAHLRDSLAELEQLGARRAASHAARLLRRRGVRDLPRGPRASTRSNPRGLSDRELEVLGLVADGMRNAQIAERLVISRKTVDHHVSAILGKLLVSSRTEAVAAASRLGILER
jgi:DNA-binding CsgD family transcriptional regulator